MAQSTMLICFQFLIINQSSRPFRVYYLVVSRDNGEPFDKSINEYYSKPSYGMLDRIYVTTCIFTSVYAKLKSILIKFTKLKTFDFDSVKYLWYFFKACDTIFL